MFMLAVMAYDRFVAVCNPLLYTVAMSPKLCSLLVAGTYTWGGSCSWTITCSLSEPSFCGSNGIHHFGLAEAFMLAVMACDRFVAVCKPLLYTAVMSPKLCASLVACPYMWGIVSSLTLTCPLQTLSFCGSNIINNFPCEHSAIVSVSCSDPFISQVISFAITIFNEVNPSHEQGAHPAGHADRVEQGAADGPVPVIGHHCQQETLRIGKDTEDQELQSAATERD
ncbi:hypothetical protein AB1E18_010975 [Capra hircus]